MQVQSRGFPAEMDTNGVVTIEVGQYCGEKMLSRMLLHVIKPAGPVYLTSGALTRQRLGEEVGDPLPLVHHVINLDTPEPPGVEWLPTGGGVKSGAIEVNPPPLVTSLHDRGLEVAQVGIGIIESLGHGNPAPEKRVG
jgi:hypothetical protein